MSDLIERQEAIDALKEHRTLYCDNTPNTFSKLSYAEKSRVDELDNAIATLVNLPSAQPERKRGRWTADGYCPFCGEHAPYWPMASTYHKSNFCPNCGADMRGEKDE